MKVLGANKSMRDRWILGFDKIPLVHLPETMQDLLSKGTVNIDDCIFLKSLFDKSHVQRGNFPDTIGYECFVNMIHLDNFVSEDFLSYAITFLKEVSTMVRKTYSDLRFMGIVSIEEANCTVRFYTGRDGKKGWLVDDLDSYEESICVIDL